jgi:hypothetical protein
MKHRIETPNKSSEEIKFIIEIEEINSSVIEMLSRYLIDNIKDLFVTRKKLLHREDYRLPVLILVDKKYFLSERILWAMIIESLDARPLIEEYIDKLCELCGDDDLPWSDDEYQIGSFPLIEYLNRDATGNGILNAFCKFLSKCDMHHETWQSEYIKKVFSHNMKADLSFLFYISIFKNPGWDWSLFVENKVSLFFVLNIQAPLKKVIDHLISDSDEEIKTDASIYKFLVAATYGSDKIKQKLVLNYVQQILQEQDLNLNSSENSKDYARYDNKNIAKVRKQADEYKKKARAEFLLELIPGF